MNFVRVFGFVVVVNYWNFYWIYWLGLFLVSLFVGVFIRQECDRGYWFIGGVFGDSFQSVQGWRAGVLFGLEKGKREFFLEVKIMVLCYLVVSDRNLFEYSLNYKGEFIGSYN